MARQSESDDPNIVKKITVSYTFTCNYFQAAKFNNICKNMIGGHVIYH